MARSGIADAAPAIRRIWCCLRARRASSRWRSLISPRLARAEVTRVDDRATAPTSASRATKRSSARSTSPSIRRIRTTPSSSISTRRRATPTGRVEFSSDLYILRPKAPRGNGAALVDVLNRGNKVVLNGVQPRRLARSGDRERSRRPLPDALRLHVVVGRLGVRPRGPADGDADPRAGRDRSREDDHRHRARTIHRRAARADDVTSRELASYDAVDPDGPDSQLTVRAQLLGAPASRSRAANGASSGHTVTLDGGFEPGKTYEISYRAANPPVAGLGFVAMRDTTAWLKHQPDALAPVRYAYALRLVAERPVSARLPVRGVQHRRARSPGVRRRDGAHRGRLAPQSERALGDADRPRRYSATAFPFADASLRDPVSGAEEGLLDNARARAHAPKVFYTNTPVEYWGTGRVAALVHTTPDGDRGSDAAGQRPRLFHRRHAAFAEPVSADDRRRPAAGQPGGLLVDDARAAAGDAQVGEAKARRRRRAATRRLRIARSCRPTSISFPAIPGVASPRALTAGPRVANPWIAGRRRRRSAAAAARARRRRGRQRARRHPAARRRRAARDLHRMEFPQSGDRARRRARVAARIVDPVSGHARRARGGQGSAPIDRGALPDRRTTISQRSRGGRRARAARLPARGRRSAHPAARLRHMGVRCS